MGTAVSPPVESLPHPAPWLSALVKETIPFFHFQQLMNVQMDVLVHGNIITLLCKPWVVNTLIRYLIVLAVTGYMHIRMLARFSGQS